MARSLRSKIRCVPMGCFGGVYRKSLQRTGSFLQGILSIKNSGSNELRFLYGDSSFTMEVVMLEEKIISKLGIHEIRAWRSAWDAAKPFHFVVIDDFLEKDFAEVLLREYPPADPSWANITYTHQKKK